MNEFLRKILALPPQSSTVADDIDALHYAVIATSTGGALLVAMLIAVFVLRYRAGRRGGRIHGAPRGLALRSEVGLIAVLAVIFVSFWIVGFRQYVRLRTAPDDTFDVYVTGKQWMWSFAYPSGAGSKGVLYVPVGRPTKLIMTSRDVIHSFFVPDFRVKQDVIPGRMTTMWFQVEEPGEYPVYCAEYCGGGHSIMRGTVVALEPEDLARRLRDQRPSGVAAAQPGDPAIVGEAAPAAALSLADAGERVAAEKGCLRCHTLDGTPHIGPTWAGVFGTTIRLADGTTIDADAAYLTRSMMDPLAEVRTGFAPVMPTYQGQLTATEVAALVELIRSLRHAEQREHDPLAPAVPEVPVQ